MDKTSYWWTGLCAVCHPGGGPSEFDRDGQRYFDAKTGEFGYEKLGRTAAEVVLDGDYAEINTGNGALQVARWDKTGVAEPDCLLCHRADRSVNDGKSMNWVWRAATLRAKEKLVDSHGDPVPAFAAAATAGQGWFSGLSLKSVPAGKPPLAASLDVDYGKAVDDGVLTSRDGALYLSSGAIARTPRDYACWGCHVTPDLKKRGRTWFDPAKDVHYAAFNRLNDANESNDIAAAESTACTKCHPAGLDGMAYNHNIAKGNANLGSVRNDTDYAGFRTCRECHLESSATRDPNAPFPADKIFHDPRHIDVLSCEACHIPHKRDPADLVIDNAVTGVTVAYKTNDFLSADPLKTDFEDRSRWYPSFAWKKDADGKERVFPVKLLLSVWWGDWDENGTPGDTSDDVIRPIPLWRVRQITKGAPLPGVADNTVNTPEEIRIYIEALRGDDSHGNVVASNPVLVKGGRVWHDDGEGGVDSFEYHDSGIKTESSHPFAINHNVRPGAEAWGAAGCSDCHGGHSTPFFDRWILVDPFGPDGKPVYKTVRGLLRLSPR